MYHLADRLGGVVALDASFCVERVEYELQIKIRICTSIDHVLRTESL